MTTNCIPEEVFKVIEYKITDTRKKGGDKSFKEVCMKTAKKLLGKDRIFLCNSKHRTLGEVLEYLLTLTTDRGFYKVSIKAIAEEIGIVRQTASILVNKLVKANIITKYYSLKGNKRDCTIFVLNLHWNYFEIMNILNNAEQLTSELASELPHYLTPCFQSGTRKKSTRFKGKKAKRMPSYYSDSSCSPNNIYKATPESGKLEPKIPQSAVDWVEGRTA